LPTPRATSTTLALRTSVPAERFFAKAAKFASQARTEN
jgi:hypothetical protein